jgi:Transposase DDE domain
MEREQDRYVRLRKCLEHLDRHCNPRCTHRDSLIACVLVWAALHDRPILWSCQADHWPKQLRPKVLPTQSCMSRRLKSVGVQQLLERAFGSLRDQLPSGLLKFIDAKPLPVGGCSKDLDALYGRAAGTKAKGYKLYSIIDAVCGAVDQWLVGPMNWSEQKAALILLEREIGPAVIIGDGEYDTTPLYDLAASRDLGFLAPPPKKAKGTGHRYISPHRLNGLSMSCCTAGLELLASRIGIEQSFAQLTSGSCGLGPLPSWVRRPHRVVVWVAAKLLIDLDRRIQLTKQKASAA